MVGSGMSSVLSDALSSGDMVKLNYFGRSVETMRIIPTSCGVKQNKCESRRSLGVESPALLGKRDEKNRNAQNTGGQCDSRNPSNVTPYSVVINAVIT